MKNHASMNRVYRLVWNAALGVWMAVAENTRGRGKGTRCARARLAGTAALGWLALLALGSAPAHAADAANASVVAGGGSVATVGNTTTINQTTQRLAIDWTSLSTAANEALVFNQPNAQAIALNRITGASPSEFLGSLTANGQVFILNPNGVLFGAGSQVNVGGLVASTLSMSNAEFMSGGSSFTQGPGAAGKVVNRGSLRAAPGGYIALLAPEVRNEGLISAQLGTALLAAGSKVTLNLDNGSLLGYSIDRGALNALAENRLLIQADGGQVLLSAKAWDSLTGATVNNSGVIEAKTVANRAGRIMLIGDMDSGTLNAGGTLDASAPDGGPGGFIETSAAHVLLADDIKVSTRSAGGQTGKWLIDPNDFTIAAAGGNITGAALGANLAATDVEIRTATMGTAGGNGDIHVNDVVSWSANKLTLSAERNININSSMNGSGSAKLALEYGQGALAAGNTANYNVKAPVGLAAGDNFSTKLGSDGTVVQYKVITALGASGSMTGTDLQGINGNLSGNYVLGADIDASATAGWSDVQGNGFEPIGVAAGMFEGRFDGLGHTIKSLYIDRPAEPFVGLFSITETTTLQNVGLVGGSIRGGSFTGALVGMTCCTTLRNVFSTASVTGDDQVGGLIGYMSGGSLSDAYSTGAVTGDYQVGGLVGYSAAGTINRSYSSGRVTGNSSVGGLVGEENDSTVNSSYWNVTTSGQAASAAGSGKSAAEMAQIATYAGWDISAAGATYWNLAPGQAAPVLRGFAPQGAVADVSGGSGQAFRLNEAYRSAMVYLAGVGRSAGVRTADAAALATALNTAAEERAGADER